MFGVLLALAIFTNWAVGQEREVDEGVYARLLSQNAGWRIWRFETRDGATCKAWKPSVGRAAGYPLGVGDAMYGGTPGLEISRWKDHPASWTLRGDHAGGRAEFRVPGERFWANWDDTGAAIVGAGSTKIEVHIVSWEYPEIYVGMSDERAIVDLTGLDAALNAIETCSLK